VARTRSAALIALGRSLARSWHAGYLGREVEILCEQPRSTPAGLEWSGLTDNYMRVRLLHEGDLHNRLARVLCTSADAQGLRGTLVTAER
jgi:tRNA A37 methylthiotransferase MiaB